MSCEKINKLKRKLCEKDEEIKSLNDTIDSIRNEIGNSIFCHPFHRILINQYDLNSDLADNLNVSAVSPLTPNKLITAYGFNLITPKPLGTGAKIAIIGAYNYPNLQSDLNRYLTQFGLPAKIVRTVNFAGSVTNLSWNVEFALDVQTIAALVPGASILVVFAKSNSFNDLLSAIRYAVSEGYNVISNSWGSYEFSFESNFDSAFTSPNTSYIFASGDNGAIPSYPSTSTRVLSVGGTTLSLNSNNTIQLQSAWSDAGAGPSAYISKPLYQSGLSGSKRSTPDLSANSSPNSGLIIYVTGYGFIVVGGTSLGCPIAASVITIANAKRHQVNKLPLSTSNGQLQTYLYKTIYTNPSLYAADIYDVTVGSVGNIPCRVGYDGCGLGAPKANTICQQLVNA